MSVYKPSGSPFYQYDFQMRGRRFHGSTKCKSRREAEAVERGDREGAKELLKVATGGVETLTIDVAAGRYWPAPTISSHKCFFEVAALAGTLTTAAFTGPVRRLPGS